MARTSDYITEVRTANKQIWDGINKLKSLQAESNALDYTNTLPDGAGINEGVTRAEVTAVVFTTTDAFVDLLGAGHATNISKLL